MQLPGMPTGPARKLRGVCSAQLVGEILEAGIADPECAAQPPDMTRHVSARRRCRKVRIGPFDQAAIPEAVRDNRGNREQGHGPERPCACARHQLQGRRQQGEHDDGGQSDSKGHRLTQGLSTDERA